MKTPETRKEVDKLNLLQLTYREMANRPKNTTFTIVINFTTAMNISGC